MMLLNRTVVPSNEYFEYITTQVDILRAGIDASVQTREVVGKNQITQKYYNRLYTLALMALMAQEAPNNCA